MRDKPEATTAVERFGRVLYWLGCGVAATIIVLGVAMLISGGLRGMAVPFAVTVLIVAVLVWLAGRACRYVLSGY